MWSAFRARRKIPRKVAAEIRALGRKAWAFAVDVADSAAVNAAAEKILADCGKVDILVNNAGVTRDGLLMRMSDADWDTVLDTNLKGAFLFTKAFSARSPRQRAGRIINISSVIGLIGNAGPVQLRGEQGGADRVHAIGGAGAGVARHHGQRHRAGLHRDGHDVGVEARSEGGRF
jgi:NAD(P)-dependent dehydrogenase (short-subunit alcohol dehydrogenase family)